jgi:hypothetical protein
VRSGGEFCRLVSHTEVNNQMLLQVHRDIGDRFIEAKSHNSVFDFRVNLAFITQLFPYTVRPGKRILDSPPPGVILYYCEDINCMCSHVTNIPPKERCPFKKISYTLVIMKTWWFSFGVHTRFSSFFPKVL